MSYDSPFFPAVAVCMTLSGVGIVLLTLSGDAQLKRRIFPVVLVVFTLGACLTVWGGDRPGRGVLGKAGFIALIVAAELWFYTQIGFCVNCGVMMRRQGDRGGEDRCPNCIAKRRTLQ